MIQPHKVVWRHTYLGLDAEPTLLAQVHKVYDGALEVGEGRHALHLDVVHLLQRVVEDSRCVDDLVAVESASTQT
jgi:hypothetical protein